MGYQPGLDGIRAVSVVAVILYHAGFSWMRGGWIGVEVFFVVSGFLIASLMLEERDRTGRTALGQFWLRRARRLLPALVTMLVVVSVWATFWGDDHLAQLRHDVLAAVFYVSNWWQIFFTDVPYFGATDPPLLRHLWSLAVEEQWYLVFPLVFVALSRRRDLAPLVLGGAAVAVIAFTAVAFQADDPDRTNFLYLSTLTRCSGLLLGAAAAYVWRPWRSEAAARRPLRALDAAGWVALAALGVLFAVTELTSAFVYRGGLALASVLSLVVVAVVVHPGAARFRSVAALPVLVAVGKRSYGLYLWHWPVFVFLDVRAGTAGEGVALDRFAAALAITAVLSELCYQLIETPIRTGILGRWFRSLGGEGRRHGLALTAVYSVSALFVVATLSVRLITAEAVDVARDDSDATFELAAPDTGSGAEPTLPAATSTSTTLATLPRSVTVVGDSQAHSLAINLPSGIETTFSVRNGAVTGCGVLDAGRLLTEREGFRRTFADCEGWAVQWASAARGSELALVMIGAWEVFDLELDGQRVQFASPASDALLRDQLQEGIDALAGAGAHVALLEVGCMRPVEVEGAGVPPLPERADDVRVAHLNDLLREVAAANGGRVTFVDGPDAWCDDPVIAADLAYRWDGVHVYKPGAKLILETIAPALLAIPL